ncbi:hypothetical protein ASPZODRAFT_166715 [Penicilliopsis zonata CBS 506.65]|uniref:Fungal N-terminal domain-containing protein n=1 Tax=Penicilliopsis zonata CBS 506.65 TaxID=1073090 RepID=A0A1L9SH89_9EURO|nr:hypothetical protein ASPZODRAFT_166715 [Penicilliopsis zonata CBS 506.65]OJJ46463.1 hypothetical protein ASPZODRAFT_166715 [Penicilliopsis zonata CBS 506.65]
MASVSWSQSINEVLQQIQDQIDVFDGLVTTLRQWVDTIDPLTYKSEAWTEEMKKAYEEYKTQEKVLGKKKNAIKDLLPSSQAPEESLNKAWLAVDWAKAALAATEGRLNFVQSYKNAFQDIDSINGHIQAGEDCLKSAKIAFEKGEKQLKDLWRRWLKDRSAY